MWQGLSTAHNLLTVEYDMLRVGPRLARQMHIAPAGVSAPPSTPPLPLWPVRCPPGEPVQVPPHPGGPQELHHELAHRLAGQAHRSVRGHHLRPGQLVTVYGRAVRWIRSGRFRAGGLPQCSLPDERALLLCCQLSGSLTSCRLMVSMSHAGTAPGVHNMGRPALCEAPHVHAWHNYSDLDAACHTDVS